MALINGQKILEILGNNNRVIYIPIYQRNYDWTVEEAQKLVGDIWNFRDVVSKDDESLYYAGSMIYKKINDDNSAQDKISLVDGQQRITTFLLLIKALDENENIPVQQYLFSNSNDKKTLKISRAKSENTLEKILSGKHDDLTNEEKGSNYWLNFVAIKEKIKNDEMNSVILFNLLSNSVGVAWVKLKMYEDENVVFETINSTGKSLTASDLIKNYILSKIHTFDENKSQILEKIYNSRIEDLFSQKDFKNDDFIRYFVAIKGNGELVKKDTKNIYKGFKSMIQTNKVDTSSFEEVRMFLLELLKSALIFQRATNKKIDDVKTYNDSKRNLFKLILRENMTYFPIYHELIDNWTQLKNNQLFFDDLKITEDLILESISKYYFYRRITGRKDKNITRDIVLYFKKFKKESERIDLDSFEDFLNNRESHDQQLPSLEHVIRNIKGISYKERGLLKHILMLVEIEENKEESMPLNILKHKLELEHILPQESNLWREEFLEKNELEKFYKFDDDKDNIQNIALLSEKRNREIKNAVFSKKIESIKKDNTIQMNSIFKRYNEYNNSFLLERMNLIIKNFASFYGSKIMNANDYLENGVEIKQTSSDKKIIESNFKLENEEIKNQIQEIEKDVINGKYTNVHSGLRTCLEHLLKGNTEDISLFDSIKLLEEENEEEIISAMHDIRRKGNTQTHSLQKQSSRATSVYALENFHKILKWKGLVEYDFDSTTYDSNIKEYIYKIDKKDKIIQREEKIIDKNKHEQEKKKLEKLNVQEKSIDRSLDIFGFVPYKQNPTKAYNKKAIEGFGKDLALEMLYLYLYEGLGNGSIDSKLLPNMKRERGWVTAATLAFYKIDTSGKSRKILYNKCTEEEAKKMIQELVFN